MRRLALALTIPLALTVGSTMPAPGGHENRAALTAAEPAALTDDERATAAGLLDRMSDFVVEAPAAGDGIDFAGRLGPAAVGFGRSALMLAINDTQGTTQRWGLRLRFPGADVVAAEPLGRTPTVVSHFTGAPEDWQTDLSTYRGVAYRDLWEGTDLMFQGHRGSLKYSFRLDPGTDPNTVALDWQGAQVAQTDGGGLRISTPAGSLTDGVPLVWQPSAAGRTFVDAAWRANPDGTWGFELGGFDPSRPLVVDPEIAYGGFIGGNGDEEGEAVAVDGSGAAYVTGSLEDTATNFPTVVGPDTSYNDGGDADAFVAKIRPDGSGFAYLGFIGGENADFGFSIAVDASGAAYVTGQTQSDETTFPVVGPLDPTQNGEDDAFVAKVKPDGTGLVYSGFLGGTEDEFGQRIVVGGDGAAYVAGATESDVAAGFPAIGGPDLTFGGDQDGYVAKVNPAGTALVYAGYVGGTDYDAAWSVAVDSSGAAYLAGETDSGDLPTMGGLDPTMNGDSDAFVTKVSPAGAFVYSGYLGGSDNEYLWDIAVDGSGALYGLGGSSSDQGAEGFPVKVGPDLTLADTPADEQDVFAVKINTAGSGIDYLGYVGGTAYEYVGGITVDSTGAAYVSGGTTSVPAEGFPVTGHADLTPNGGDDGFVGKIVPSGAAFEYLGYFGGVKDDGMGDHAMDALGSLYLTGDTASDPASFGARVGPDLTRDVPQDAFIAKLAELCGGKVASIIGTDGKNKIKGTGAADVIVALGGKDNIKAGGGDDVVCAGGGADTVNGGGGKDRLFGEGGKDRLDGAGGNGDVCKGGPGKDEAEDCEKGKA